MGFLENLTSKIGQIDDMNKIEKLVGNVIAFCDVQQDIFETTKELSERIKAENQSLSDFLVAADRRIHELYQLNEIESDEDNLREFDCWKPIEGEAERNNGYDEERWLAEISKFNFGNHSFG